MLIVHYDYKYLERILKKKKMYNLQKKKLKIVLRLKFIE